MKLVSDFVDEFKVKLDKFLKYVKIVKKLRRILMIMITFNFDTAFIDFFFFNGNKVNCRVSKT